MHAQAAYEQLICRSREQAMLASCIELLDWDELVYMPRGGLENRGRQMAFLAGLLHQGATDPRLGELLAAVEPVALAADPESPAAVNVREWRRSYDRLTRVPRELVQELAAVATAGQQAWAEARRNDDFAQFLPWLERIVKLKREEGACLSPEGDLYGALLEEFEPDASAADLAATFEALRGELTRLLREVSESPQRARPGILSREYPIDRQRIFAEAVAADVGFDFERGRLDATTHPFFSLIGPGDCRLTTRYNHGDFGDAFFAMLHELGHGLYEQGLEPEHYGTPFGEASSLSIHESQSRLWEKFIGQSLPFWQHFFPRAREMFHDALHDVTLRDFHRAVNHVQPGWCRVRADAVTYDLHVLVRFELEQALIAQELAPSDLPEAWNQKYREYLQVEPLSDAEGCLQDGHWAAGQFGYFPWYTMGNVYAAQLYARIRADLPRLDRDMAEGRFTELLAWLRSNIYRHGRSFPAAKLIERATGQRPGHLPLVAALRQTCAEVFGMG